MGEQKHRVKPHCNELHKTLMSLINLYISHLHHMFNRVKTNHCMKFAKFLQRIPADNQPQMHTVWPLKSNPEIPLKSRGRDFKIH